MHMQSDDVWSADHFQGMPPSQSEIDGIIIYWDRVFIALGAVVAVIVSGFKFADWVKSKF